MGSVSFTRVLCSSASDLIGGVRGICLIRKPELYLLSVFQLDNEHILLSATNVATKETADTTLSKVSCVSMLVKRGLCTTNPYHFDIARTV